MSTLANLVKAVLITGKPIKLTPEQVRQFHNEFALLRANNTRSMRP